jgi:hypothetical protein
LTRFTDLSTYLSAKERAIRRFDLLSYAGEEDLLALLPEFDEAARQHVIDVEDEACNVMHVGEGLWHSL